MRSLGSDVEVWVAGDLSFEDDRPDPVITQEQVDQLRDEFDHNIYPTDTEFFGRPDSHYGTHAQLEAWGLVPTGYYEPADGIERSIILVDNIRDESYYDDTYPFFIAGFYSSTYEGYFDRNIINLDTNAWETRLETTFFGTTAHEYQHLIHDDNDSHEETWLNEGMSDFAEYLCGYGHPEGHVNFFLDHPENSLVDWDEHYGASTGPETLADYGQAYLLQLYLHDQFGPEFTRALATSPISGFASVDAVLSDFGTGIDFEEAFRRFSVAVAIDDSDSESGIYGFSSIDLFDEPFGGLNFESALLHDKDGVPAWGGDYKHLENSYIYKGIHFDGIDFLPTPWVEVEESPMENGPALYGNMGDEKDNILILPVDLTELAEAELNFNTWYNIEEHWDFGMVQVSVDHGQTWTSLENEYTSYDIVPEGYPKIYDQLPGLTASSAGVWMPMTFDLDDYSGQEIHIAFRYMTDWGYNEEGWYIKDIEVPGVDLGIENGSLEGFFSLQEITQTYVDYQVVFISKTGKDYHVLSLDPVNVTEMDAMKLKRLLRAGETYMIVWYPAPEGTKGYVNFMYEFLTPHDMNKGKGDPGGPVVPEDPMLPSEPAEPGDPGDPAEPADPTKPDKPGKPEKPGKPDHPDHPEHPRKPEK